MTEKGKVEAQLKGNTLRVYVYALRKGRVGVREVQRSLAFSNPSLAQYHLNKLKELGLVRDENGEYEVVNEVKVDVMRGFLRVGTLLVPRFIFYAVFFSVCTLYLGVVSLTDYTVYPQGDLVHGVAGSRGGHLLVRGAEGVEGCPFSMTRGRQQTWPSIEALAKQYHHHAAED